MSTPWRIVTETDIGDYFDGVMIPVREPWGDVAHVPGWRCKQCAWTVGARGLPPAHSCPLDGDLQRAAAAAREGGPQQ